MKLDLIHRGVKITVAALVATASLAKGADVEAEKKAKQLESVPGQYVVQLRHERSRFNQKKHEKHLGGKIISQVRSDMVLLQRPIGENSGGVADNLRSLSEVQIIEPNYIFHATLTPNDPDYGKLWGINNKGLVDSKGMTGISGVDMNLEKAWNIQTGSRDVVVAVIDTGVNYKHPDLAANIWTNQAEANGIPGVDDDNNGYIDDVHGYNFNTNTPDPMDDNGHGSHCAGTIGAEGNNGTGVVGVNWRTSIMALKFLDSNGAGTLDNAIKAIEYARKSKAVVLSNSWGGNMNSEILKTAIEGTRDAGQLFVAAAGNENADNDSASASYPASFPLDNIVSVAAINNRGELAYFSNYGAKSVHVAAPGVNILSTSLGSGYETLSGTSMAAPHVAGLAALLIANERSLTYQDVKARLIATARPLASLNGRTVSGGLVDAFYALTNQKAPPDLNDPAIWEQVAQQTSSNHPYPNSAQQSFTITVPGAKRLSVHFSKFETESGYDKLEFVNSKGESSGFVSGNQSGRFGPLVEGDTVTLKFTSDASVNGYGFDIDSVAVLR